MVNELDNDVINITWHIDDVKSLDDTLTDEQCREVLHLVKHNHDATMGVSWDTLSYWIEEIKQYCPCGARLKLENQEFCKDCI